MDTNPTQSMLDALHIADLPPEEQMDTILQINEMVFNAVMVKVIEHLDDKSREKLKELLDNDAPEDKVDAFIEAHVPHIDKLVQETFEETKNDILAVMGD